MTNCQRGDVVLVLFHDSNLRTARRRPALVIQSDSLGTGLSQTILAMISSNMRRVEHPSRVTVFASSPEAKLSGLLKDSVIMTDNLVTVALGEIDRIIRRFAGMSAVDSALRATLSL